MSKLKHRTVTPILEKWRRRLLLNEWRLDAIYPDKPSEHDQGDYECMAEIAVRPEYLFARITIYPCWFKAPKDVKEHTLVHELCHIVTEPAKAALHKMINGQLVTEREQIEINEVMTERVTNIAFNSLGRTPSQVRPEGDKDA